MPLNLVGLLAVITHRLLCVDAVLVQHLVSGLCVHIALASVHIPANPDTGTGLIRTPVFLAFL